MPETRTDQDRFDSLVALYAAGSLGAEDRAWMRDYVQSHPEAANELKWHVGMTQQMHARFDDVPVDVGFEKAIARVRQLPKRAPEEASSGWRRLLEWFFGGTPRLSPAFALLLACALVPGWVLLQRDDPQHTTYRGERAGLFDGPLLRVNFKADARESEIRFLLLEQGGLVVGPTRLGDWFIRVAPDRLEKVREAVAKSPLVISADVVPALPAELVDQ